MDLRRSLFDGNLVCLAPIDPEGDAEIESKWSHNAEYLRLLNVEPSHLLSPYQVKKKYEQIEKKIKENEKRKVSHQEYEQGKAAYQTFGFANKAD